MFGDMHRGDWVYELDGSGRRWAYRDLASWARAANGLDDAFHRITAVIDGLQLRVQHGENPEAVRWFSLDELNQVGGRWDDGDPVLRWCEDIDGRS